MGLPSSARVSRAQTYSLLTGDNSVFDYGTVTLYGSDFQRIRLTGCFVTPYGQWAGPFSLAATQGVAIAFLSCGY
jgi:hypothetical protein